MPISEDKRKDIAEDIAALAGTPAGSVRALAERHAVSRGSVYNIAQEAGLGDAWAENATRTANATATVLANLGERRAALQAGLLDDIAELRGRLFGDVVHLNVVKIAESMEEVAHTVLPAGPAEWRATMGAVTAATREAINLARFDAETAGTGAASGLLEQFETSLRQAREQRERAAADVAAAEQR